jgi:Fuc2NAc and GlcNAc transferase
MTTVASALFAEMLGIALLAWASIAITRRYALSRGVLDAPGDRSSHTIPTPRGAGVGLIVGAVAGFVLLERFALDAATALALTAVMPTAFVGWIDDHRPLPVLPRLSAHVLSGLLLVPVAVSNASTDFTPVVGLLAVFLTVSAINVINFMDGIDGLIGLQALVFASHISIISPPASASRLLSLALGAASVGFLAWNWSPAKIFLGDVGSGGVAVLGLIAGFLAWGSSGRAFIEIFLPLFAIFLDATVAMYRRIKRRESLTTAHRSHLYQRLANEQAWGHAKVSLTYGIVAAAGLAVVQAPDSWRVVAVPAYLLVVTLLGWRLDAFAALPKASALG